MRITQLLLGEAQTSLRRLGLMVAVAGISNAALIAVINSAAEHIKEDEPQVSAVLMFLFFIISYIYSQRYVLRTTTAEVESMVHRYRERLIGRLKMCELQEMEHIGRGRIFSVINADMQTISQTTSSLVMGAQAGVLIICASAYLATISLVALVFSGFFMTVAARIYLNKMQRVSGSLHQASAEESRLHDLVSDLLDGFKEVKLSSRRAAAVLADVVVVSRHTAACRTMAQQAMNGNLVFAQVSFLLLLGTLVFVTPMFGSTYSGSIMESMTTVIFLIGPISALVATVPQVAVANAAAENLYKLEQLLASSTREKEESAQVEPGFRPLPVVLHTLKMRDLFYSYFSDGSRFDVGPVNLTLKAGEVVFITGGNGSGKSTLIKLLTGLYRPLSGELLVNDVPVTTDGAQRYRDRFCAVFSDFHLFRKFYGIDLPGPEVLDAWLTEMEITDKTAIVDGAFSTIDLSTGQKKRLALISAILEDKPLIVLDEWAADQDPHFRRKFYDELLPRLKAAGKTVIAVTHDDRFFHLADRRLHMEEGQLRDLTETQTNG